MPRSRHFLTTATASSSVSLWMGMPPKPSRVTIISVLPSLIFSTRSPFDRCGLLFSFCAGFYLPVKFLGVFSDGELFHGTHALAVRALDVRDDFGQVIFNAVSFQGFYSELAAQRAIDLVAVRLHRQQGGGIAHDFIENYDRRLPGTVICEVFHQGQQMVLLRGG